MPKVIHLIRKHAVNLLLLALAVFLGLVVYSLVEQGASTQSVQSYAHAVNSYAHAVDSYTHELAQERSQAILDNCRSQNSRHRHTVAELDRLLRRAERHRSRAKRAQIAANRGSTILLINQMFPYQNCRKVLATSTSTTSTTSTK